MAFFDSKLSVFKIDDTGSTLRDVSPYITSIDGLPGPRRLYPVTALGDSGDKYHPGLQGATITLELMWSVDASVGPDTVFGPLRTHTSAVDFEYYPEGTTKYSGTCWVEDFNIHTRVNNLVMATVVMKVDGTVTRTAA